MLTTISRLRRFHRLTFCAAERNYCQENSTNSPTFLVHKHFRGYAAGSSIHFSNDLLNKHFNKQRKLLILQRTFSESSQRELDPLQFEKISGDTLDSLTEYFDELVEGAGHLQEADVSYGDGVLTIKFGSEYGTYVINRQSPNKQIWLSSPKSGPKRYDFIDNTWIYKHDGKSLHQILDDEIPAIIKGSTSFSDCLYSGNVNSKK